jgi:TerC family integral membrane protein
MTHSAGTPLMWGAFATLISVMLIIDLFLQRGRPHTMTVKHAALWSLLWISLSLSFNAGFWWYSKSTSGIDIAHQEAMTFLTGYLLEKALSIDNVFVWMMLFGYFAIPTQLQRRVLVYGVLGAIVLRTIMIFTGSWLVSEFGWILYLFGAFLLFTGLKMAFAKEHESNNNNRLIDWLKRHLRITEQLQGNQFFTRKNGLLYATPLFLTLVMVELSDVIFAVDSIPAIFAVTTDPFIVLTSNLFAILGLRAMYFLLAGMAEKFSLLKYGLAAILVFIGIKMLIMKFVHIPVGTSLAVIASILLVTIGINLKLAGKPAR